MIKQSKNWTLLGAGFVSNSDDALLRMLNSEFSEFATSDYDFYPAELRAEIDALNKTIYERVNNGLYLAGFATSQGAYERAAKKLCAPGLAALLVRPAHD